MKKNNYYKKAFTEKFNIAFLSIILLLSLGLPWIALPGFILEILYMLIVPNSKSYKHLIDSENKVENDPNLKTKDLSPSIKSKIRNIEKKRHEIKKIVKKKKNISQYIKDDLEKLDFLIENYISFYIRISDYKNYLLKNNPNIIKDEINKVKSKINNSFKNLDSKNNIGLIYKRIQQKSLLEENLKILGKRFRKINEIKDLSETLQTQVNVIEDTFHLVSDHIITFQTGNSVALDVDKIVSNIEKTQQTVNETYDEMNQLQMQQMQSKILD